MDARALADEDLIPLMARGDARAFEAIYERHSGAAYSLAYRMVGTRSAAEDVTQEAFLNLWRSGAHYDRARGSVRTWILGIVHHRAIDALRRASVHSKRRSDDETAAERLEAPERVEEDVARRDEAAIVRNAMEILPADQLKVIELAYFGGFTHVEIAEHARAAGRHREGAHAPRDEEDARGARAGSGRMTTGPEHDRWDDAAATYVLGALTDSERDGYEAHLKTCPVCRDEVEDLRMAAEALPVSPLPMLPPPALKARIMAEVEREAQLLASAGAPERTAPKREKRRRFTFGGGALALPRPALAALACALLLAGVGLGGLLFSGGGGRTVPFESTLPQASAELEIGDDGAILVADGLPAPPEGKTYMVWIQRDEARSSRPRRSSRRAATARRRRR